MVHWLVLMGFLLRTAPPLVPFYENAILSLSLTFMKARESINHIFQTSPQPIFITYLITEGFFKV